VSTHSHEDKHEAWLQERARHEEEEKRRHKENADNLLRFNRRLFGSEDRHDWQAPSALEDFDAALGEHAAQLRNAARHIMEKALADHSSVESQAKAVNALTSLIRANIQIAKALGTKEKKSKTVRGGGGTGVPQD